MITSRTDVSILNQSIIVYLSCESVFFSRLRTINTTTTATSAAARISAAMTMATMAHSGKNQRLRFVGDDVLLLLAEHIVKYETAISRRKVSGKIGCIRMVTCIRK